MITIPSGVRVLLATRPVDFRKGAHGLAAPASAVRGEDPFSGVAVAFRAKRADRVKILVWDASGLVLVWKQLQQGAFRWPPVMDGALRLSAVEFAALFDGLGWTRVQAVRRTPTPTAAGQGSQTMRAITRSCTTFPKTGAALRVLLLAARAERDRLASRNDRLRHLLLRLKRMQFGTRSERLASLLAGRARAWPCKRRSRRG